MRVSARTLWAAFGGLSRSAWFALTTQVFVLLVETSNLCRWIGKNRFATAFRLRRSGLRYAALTECRVSLAPEGAVCDSKFGCNGC